MSRPDLEAVRQALGLALRAVALGGAPRGERARELLAAAHRASMGAPVEAAARPPRRGASPLGARFARPATRAAS